MTRKLLIGLLLVFAALIITGCTAKNCPECKGRWDTGMLDIDLYQAAQNINNEDEFFFEYWISNYGDVEAKDIIVKCKVIDEDLNTLIEVEGNYGNLASRSMQLGSLSTDVTPEYIALPYDALVNYGCMVTSCTNCEILIQRIPDALTGF